MKQSNIHVISTLGIDLVPLFTGEPQLCRLQTQETLLILSGGMFLETYVTALMGTYAAIGSQAVTLQLPTPYTMAFPKLVADAWSAADVAVPLLRQRPWLYSDPRDFALNAGNRTLMIQEPLNILRRLFTDPEVQRHTEAGGARLQQAIKIKIRFEAGTDPNISIEKPPGIGQYGIADTYGRWYHWPSGLGPLEGSAEGTLVLNKGDVIFDFGRYVKSRAIITIQEGCGTCFEGGTDATFGSNFSRFLGGANRSRFHISPPTRNHSIWLDNDFVVDQGAIVLPSMN